MIPAIITPRVSAIVASSEDATAAINIAAAEVGVAGIAGAGVIAISPAQGIASPTRRVVAGPTAPHLDGVAVLVGRIVGPAAIKAIKAWAIAVPVFHVPAPATKGVAKARADAVTLWLVPVWPTPLACLRAAERRAHQGPAKADVVGEVNPRPFRRRRNGPSARFMGPREAGRLITVISKVQPRLAAPFSGPAP